MSVAKESQLVKTQKVKGKSKGPCSDLTQPSPTDLKGVRVTVADPSYGMLDEANTLFQVLFDEANTLVEVLYDEANTLFEVLFDKANTLFEVLYDESNTLFEVLFDEANTVFEVQLNEANTLFEVLLDEANTLFVSRFCLTKLTLPLFQNRNQKHKTRCFVTGTDLLVQNQTVDIAVSILPLAVMRCIVIWALYSAMIISMHNSIHPPEMKINPPNTACYAHVAE